MLLNRTNRNGVTIALFSIFCMVAIIGIIFLVLNVNDPISIKFYQQQLVKSETDLLNIINETESLVGVMASILITAVALVISVWLLYWSQNIDSITNIIMYFGNKIRDTKGNIGNSNINTIKKIINDLKSQVETIEKYKKLLTILFIGFILLSIMIMVFLIGFRFLFNWQISVYIFLVLVMTLVLSMIVLILATFFIFPRVFKTDFKINIQRQIIEIIDNDLKGEGNTTEKREE